MAIKKYLTQEEINDILASGKKVPKTSELRPHKLVNGKKVYLTDRAIKSLNTKWAKYDKIPKVSLKESIAQARKEELRVEILSMKKEGLL